MSVLIKGIEMPKSCLICVCNIPKGNCDLWRNQTPEEHRRERHPDCPLVEVPTPHGRLIDADALIKLLDNCMFPSDMVTTRAVSMARNWLIDALTIIESEGEDESR